MVLKTQFVPDTPGGLVKTYIAEPDTRVSDSVCLRWGLKILISEKFPGNSDAVNLGKHAWGTTSLESKQVLNRTVSVKCDKFNNRTMYIGSKREEPKSERTSWRRSCLSWN